MTVEIGGAEIFSVVVLVIASLIGMWAKRVQSDQRETAIQLAAVRTELATLRERFAREANDYARRTEMEALMRRIEDKLDRMTEKLNAKQDRQA